MTSPRPQTRCSVEAGHHAVEHPNDREMLRSYAFDAHGERRRGSPQAAAVDAQGQPGPALWPAAWTASPIPTSSRRDRTRSVPAMRACSDSRAWSPSTARAPTAAAGSGTGSRSRTGTIQRSAGCRISSVEPRSAGRRRSRLSVIGSPPLPLAAACAPGSSWTLRASPLGDSLMWPRNHPVPSPAKRGKSTSAGGTNDGRHRSKSRVGPVEAGPRDLGGLESSGPRAARRSHNSHAQRAFQARRVWARAGFLITT